MTSAIKVALALGLVAAASVPAFADCAGHVSADKEDRTVTTADSGDAPPPATDRQG